VRSLARRSVSEDRDGGNVLVALLPQDLRVAASMADEVVVPAQRRREQRRLHARAPVRSVITSGASMDAHDELEASPTDHILERYSDVLLAATTPR